LAGYGATEGGVLIDLSAMQAIHIDPDAWVACVEAGTSAGRLTAATEAHGLVIPFGDSPTVGVGGITLGGGIGRLGRKVGLTIDGNFGVITRFRCRLHPIGAVLGGALFLPATHELIRGVIDLANAAPMSSPRSR
jgi:FAD/FMN-containing dehydrogenase